MQRIDEFIPRARENLSIFNDFKGYLARFAQRRISPGKIAHGDRVGLECRIDELSEKHRHAQVALRLVADAREKEDGLPLEIDISPFLMEGP